MGCFCVAVLGRVFLSVLYPARMKALAVVINGNHNHVIER